MRATIVGLLVLACGGLAHAGSGTVKGTVASAEKGAPPVADAVVMIAGVAVPAAPDTAHPVVDQRHDTFVPRVTAVAVGTTVDFPNDDPRLHNVFSASGAKKFDLGMYPQGESRSVTFDKPGVVRVACSVHPKMEAFIVVHENPYVAVTDAHGAWTIAGVPPGHYRLRVWHERLGESEVPVTVSDGQVQSVDLRVGAGR